MSASMTQLLSCSVSSRDGRAGPLSDLLFDDWTWHVKWLVVEMGPWLFGREVLITPDSLLYVDGMDDHLQMDLTLEQIEQSADIRSDPPHHLQNDGSITYGELMPFEPANFGIVYRPPQMLALFASTSPNIIDRLGNSHLRSAAELLGYEVGGPNGRLGFLKDLQLSSHLSCVEKAVVQSRRWWWPRQELLIASHAISRIEWSQQRLALARPQEHGPKGVTSSDVGSIGNEAWSSGIASSFG
jgi:hypothetical protein